MHSAPAQPSLPPQAEAFSWRKATAISLVILTCLSLQAGAVLNGLYHFVPDPACGWPFLYYPMYKSSHQAGEPIDQYVLYGTIEGATERELKPVDFGLNFWKFSIGPVEAMRKQDEENLRFYAEVFRRHQHQELISLRLETHPVTPGRTGPVPLPVAVLSTVELRPDGPRWGGP